MQLFSSGLLAWLLVVSALCASSKQTARAASGAAQGHTAVPAEAPAATSDLPGVDPRLPSYTSTAQPQAVATQGSIPLPAAAARRELERLGISPEP